MRGVIMYTPDDVEVVDRDDPTIVEPTDAVIRLTATCICGSDLHPYHGREEADDLLMGHEYLGVVEQVRDLVTSVEVGDPVIWSFAWSDNTCEICWSGYQTKCVHGDFFHGNIGTQADKARIPLADGTLVKLPSEPTEDQVPHLPPHPTCSAPAGSAPRRPRSARARPSPSSVTARWAAGRARRQAHGRRDDHRHVEVPGSSGAGQGVRRDAHRRGARRGGHRQGQGAHQRARRPLGHRGRRLPAVLHTGDRLHPTGQPHGLRRRQLGVEIPGIEMFFADIHLHGGPAPVRRYRPELVEKIYAGEIEPGRVFDLALPIEQAAEGYRAMADRDAIKVMLTL